MAPTKKGRASACLEKSHLNCNCQVIKFYKVRLSFKPVFLQAPICQARLCLLPKVCWAEGAQGLGAACQRCCEKVQAGPKFWRSHSCHTIRVPLFHIGRLEKTGSRECWPALEAPAPLLSVLQPWFHSLCSHGGTLGRLRLLHHQGQWLVVFV